MRIISVFRHTIFALSLVACASSGAWAAKTGDVITNSLLMDLIYVEAGTYAMGSKNSSSEHSRHQVTLTKPFYLAAREVTQEEWTFLMGYNPTDKGNYGRIDPKDKINIGRKNPVTNMTWDEAQRFIKKLNEREKTTRYRLPTEAEWEIASRAGTTYSDYFFADTWDDAFARGERISRYAWYANNADKRIHPVGQKDPNPWGFYDIYGNAAEWVNDKGRLMKRGAKNLPCVLR